MCLATVPVIALLASALRVEGKRVASDVRRELKSVRAGLRAKLFASYVRRYTYLCLHVAGCCYYR